MREIYNFYYKAELNGLINYGKCKVHAVSPEDANFKLLNWAENNGIYILDFDCETEEIEEEREF